MSSNYCPSILLLRALDVGGYTNRTLERGGYPLADGSLSEFVDWILGTLIALDGLVTIVGGTVLMSTINHETLAESIEDEPSRSPLV